MFSLASSSGVDGPQKRHKPRSAKQTTSEPTDPQREIGNRNHWTTLLESRVAIGDFKHQHNHRHRHSALGYLMDLPQNRRGMHYEECHVRNAKEVRSRVP